jgi:transglutaminase-like putative cysteine protease
MYRITIGCQLEYVASTAQPAVFIVQPPAHPRQMIDAEVLTLSGAKPTGSFVDQFGNRCQRVTLLPGQSALRYEAQAVVPREADAVNPQARMVPPEELPDQLLRYTLPSRYAETDVLLGFAWEKFAHVPAGWERARAICDWVHDEVKYEQGVSRWYWSAADTIVRRQGVCRDRAHAVVALCRAFNMPARYAVSYLPDIDVEDDGIPPDFHAYAEVWLEGGWQVFDPHDRFPRKGRVFLASGLDAADAAFATLYGGARLVKFAVRADQVRLAVDGPVLDRPVAAAAGPAAADAAPAAAPPVLAVVA